MLFSLCMHAPHSAIILVDNNFVVAVLNMLYIFCASVPKKFVLNGCGAFCYNSIPFYRVIVLSATYVTH